MIVEDELDGILTEDFLLHVGIARRSGRYPWGSGDNAHQRNKKLVDHVNKLRDQGLSMTEIARGMDISSGELIARNSNAKNALRNADAARAQILRDAGNSNVAIGAEMGINESSVRALLNPVLQAKANEVNTIADILRENIESKRHLDIGEGVEGHMGVSRTKLLNAALMLKDEGYRVDKIQVPQPSGTKETTVLVLSAPGSTYGELFKNPIGSISEYSEDNGKTFLGIETPVSVNPKRVAVRYAEDGGDTMDGVIQLRRGVEDISLGESRYAQVRIAVGDGHYLKGMAMYADDLPDGIDMRFNTNKSNTGNDLKAMKGLKDDADNPFGSIVRQKHYIDADGKKKLSALNIVGSEDPDGVKRAGEEGAWSQWSSKLSSQMMSKQSPVLAQQQLGMTFEAKKNEFDAIMALTNPTIKKKLLEKFAEGADSSAVHLKAAGLPRTANHVILPINSLKDNEIFAPNYNNGDKVVLVRHPHGGIFEIPELTVNNRNREANKVIPQARDAVGINSKVASRLSGADFDGDTVLVIPNTQSGPSRVKNSPPLAALKDFEPQKRYPKYDGMKTIDGGTYNAKTDKVEWPPGKKPSGRAKQQEMGNISNLITDMTIRGASQSEIARAVKHSMVVIDAEKHSLNYKQSALDNNIRALKVDYQGAANRGASTLISRASSEIRVNDRKDGTLRDGGKGPVDKATGKRLYEETGKGRTIEAHTKINKRGKEVHVPEKFIPKTISSTKMFETDDANSLLSKGGGTPMEKVYANHANKLKALTNSARKSAIETPPLKYSPSSKIAYAPEFSSLKAKLNVAYKNKPLERQALLFSRVTIEAKKQANPNMSSDELKKVKTQAMEQARSRTGAKKQQIVITPKEWEAIQAGAISNNFLGEILKNTDIDAVKQMAMPREKTVMTSAKVARAKAMMASGYTQAEVAAQLGVPTSTLNDSL